MLVKRIEKIIWTPTKNRHFLPTLNCYRPRNPTRAGFDIRKSSIHRATDRRKIVNKGSPSESIQQTDKNHPKNRDPKKRPKIFGMFFKNNNIPNNPRRRPSHKTEDTATGT